MNRRCFFVLISLLLSPQQAISRRHWHNRNARKKGAKRGLRKAGNHRIIGGNIARKDKFPFFAFLNVAQNLIRSSRCGAVLVHEDVLLTAAHCLAPDTIITSVINATQNPYISGLTGYEQIRLVTRGIIHQGFISTSDNETLLNDIAALKLDNPVYDITPLTIYPDVDIPADTTATNIGLGDITGSLDAPAELMEVSLSVHSNQVCEEQYMDLFDEEIMLCAGGAASDSVEVSYVVIHRTHSLQPPATSPLTL